MELVRSSSVREKGLSLLIVVFFISASLLRLACVGLA
jgi:hypothetical protein